MVHPHTFNINECDHIQLWKDLNALVQDSDAFYFNDVELEPVDGLKSRYRIFNYRLASYTDFQQPGALECRGIMFEINDNNEMVRLAARPMEKFFNVNENPFTMDLDPESILTIMDKADGSLISTFAHCGTLAVKSKGSLTSEQAVDALEFIKRPENEAFGMELYQLSSMGYTVNMEWCAPHNRIVMGYREPQLIVLNIRHNDTGEYIDTNDSFSDKLAKGAAFPEVHARSRELYTIEDFGFETKQAFMDESQSLQDREGFVIEFRTLSDDEVDQQAAHFAKLKTEWYLVQHRAKDSINSPRRLYEAVLEEATDDLRTLFHEDDMVIERIEVMEQLVESIYNPLVATVEKYYADNKQLERKEYAIKGQQELTEYPGMFGLAMSLYSGKTVDYKLYMKKQYKAFGIRDEELTQE